MKKLPVALAVSALVLAGCTSTIAAARTVEVSSSGMNFDVKEITAARGKPVKLVYNNKDVQLHDWSIDTIPVEVKASQGDAHEHNEKNPPAVHVAADAGKTSTVEFTPTTAGSYAFYCTVPGHREFGMQGTLIVK
jgi:uncharacterized cupredoxin-like copper-binding protein